MLCVETIDLRVLIDPCFSNDLLNGVLVYNPGRKLAVEKMPIPDILVVTHGHFDHLHWQSLAQLPHDLPLLTSKQSSWAKRDLSLRLPNMTRQKSGC